MLCVKVCSRPYSGGKFFDDATAIFDVSGRCLVAAATLRAGDPI
jgi:hypothetical protein